MKLKWLVVAGAAFGCLVAPSAAAAQEEQGWSVDAGAGTSPTVGDISSRLSTGWNFDLRGGYQFNRTLELFGEFAYSGLDVKDRVLNALQVPNGNAALFSLTAGPMVRFPIGGHLDAYVLGGVGWYRRRVEFTQPTVSVIDVIDPWWGYIGPVIVPADQVLGSVTRDAFGGNAGGGVSFRVASNTAVFAEVRYHYANTKPTSTSVVPVSFGVRWSGQPHRRPRRP